MEPEQPSKVWTYDELAALPDGHRYEILDGELFVDGQPYHPGAEYEVSPSPSGWHQRLSGRLFLALHAALEPARLGQVYYAPLDVVFGPSRTVQPDLLVLRSPRRASDRDAHGLTERPELVVEILSPATQKHDRQRKRRFYARGGVREYWIVDPESETVEVLALIEGGLSYRQIGWYAPGDVARSSCFPIEVDVAALFRPDDDAPPA